MDGGSVTGNDAVRGGGLYIDDGGVVAIAGVDFGDNAPDDVGFAAVSAGALGADATVTCDPAASTCE